MKSMTQLQQELKSVNDNLARIPSTPINPVQERVKTRLQTHRATLKFQIKRINEANRPKFNSSMADAFAGVGL